MVPSPGRPQSLLKSLNVFIYLFIHLNLYVCTFNLSGSLDQDELCEVCQYEDILPCTYVLYSAWLYCTGTVHV